MAARKANKKVIEEGSRRAVAPRVGLDAAHLALPDEEIRRLVLRITASGNIEPFVRRMVRFIDSLRTGRRVRVARVARRGANVDLVTLTSAMSRAVEEERLSAAYFTAFLAAHYAYQNSLDYACELLKYLDRFRRDE
jgi:hypothetical protein